MEAGCFVCRFGGDDVVVKRILLIQLGANGDCLYATTVARQIKQDYPGCHLTWAIAEKYQSVLKNNPYVDSVWTVSQLSGESLSVETWYRIKQEATASQKYDLIFSTQVYPDNVSNFDGVIRSSMFANYSDAITVPVDPVVELLPEEYVAAADFIQKYNLRDYKNVVLFECSPGSGQSCLNLEKGLNIGQRLLSEQKDMVIVMSTHHNFTPPNPRIISGRELSFRENLALAECCTFLIGGSSGISWLLTALKSKRIPTVQFINCTDAFFASMVYDLKHWRLPVDHIIENESESDEVMSAIVSDAIRCFPEARRKYHTDFRPRFWCWVRFIDYRRGIRGVFQFWKPFVRYVQRNGLRFSDLFDVGPLFIALKYLFQRLHGRGPK